MSKYVSHVRDIPTRECWVIVKDISIGVPGDERSRQAPGHGYPEHTDHYAQVYEVFDTEAEFKDALARSVVTDFKNGGANPGVRGMKVVPYDFTLSVVVKSTPAKS